MYATNTTSLITPSTMLAIRSDSVASSAKVERKSGRTKKIPTAKPREKIMVPIIMGRLIWMSSPSAAMAAERMSIRVPSTSVSYSTNIPRTNGTLSQRPYCSARGSGSEKVSISPLGGRTVIATVVRPRIMTPSIRAWPP